MSRRSGVDVTDPEAVADWLDQFVDKHGAPELLVNCAGITEPASFLEMPVESFRRQLDVNLTGTFIASQEFSRRVSGAGMIVNVASTAGTRPSPGWAAYAASKAAVINLSQTMAAELEPHGIRVYCLVPGRCATPLRRTLEPEEDQATIMQPDEVARVVELLFRDPGLLIGQPILVRRP
jgi:3-oxoacyl-[acyl-carrier protein] reductase